MLRLLVDDGRTQRAPLLGAIAQLRSSMVPVAFRTLQALFSVEEVALHVLRLRVVDLLT